MLLSRLPMVRARCTRRAATLSAALLRRTPCSARLHDPVDEAVQHPADDQAEHEQAERAPAGCRSRTSAAAARRELPDHS